MKTVEKGGEFLARVFGTSTENAVGLLGDKLEYWRWERQIRMIDKVNEYQKERGLRITRPIPPKFAIPMITNASLEEDNDLQEMWCKLIINALDYNFKSEIRFAYIDIIKSLTSLDAKILKFVYDAVYNKLKSEGKNTINIEMAKISLNLEDLNDRISGSEEELLINFNNLMRVQCLRNPSLENAVYVENEITIFKKGGKMRVALTPLGIAFIEVCIK